MAGSLVIPRRLRAAEARARPTKSANPAAGFRVIKIIAGEHHVTADPGGAITTVLGSCVAACIRDSLAGIGGMNHFMLPTSDVGSWGNASASLRYGNFAMEALINDIMSRGGARRRLEAKVFGGAQMLHDRGGIGERNAQFVLDYLQTEGVTVVASDLLGPRGRKLIYRPVSGEAFVAPLGVVEQKIAEAERRYRNTLPERAAAGSIELFD